MIFDAKLVCPKCGCESPFKNFQPSEEILEISRMAAKFGKTWPWVEEYLHCFQSALDKPLKAARMKLILEDLLRYIDQNGFNIDKHWYTIRPDALFAAIRHVAQLNKIGFKNHNYLKKVGIDFNQKMIAQEEREQKIRGEEAMIRLSRGPERIRELIGKIQ